MDRISLAFVAILVLVTVAASVNAACPCADSHATEASATESTDPRVWTDKADYAPGETVHIGGGGFDPAADLRMRVTCPDGSTVTGDGSFAPWPTAYDNVEANGEGTFAYDYILDGIEGEYLVQVLDSKGEVIAACTFTDGGAIIGVTLIYQTQSGAHVTVPPGASIAAIITVETYDEEYDTSLDWESTGWKIGNSWFDPSGALRLTCVDHGNHSGVGTYSEGLIMTAPQLAGTYDARFIVYHADMAGQPPVYRPCSIQFDSLVMSGAVEVECTPPSITSPNDITQDGDPGSCGAVVTWADPAATGNPPPTTSCSPNSGSTFPVGATTVTCTATNTCGTDTADFTVVVNDAEAPQMACPADIAQDNDPGVCQAAVSIPQPAATDNCGIEGIVNDFNGTADASDIYPVGATAVLWTVRDLHGNTSTCTMNVTVNDAEAPTVEFVTIPPNSDRNPRPLIEWAGADDNGCTPSEDLEFSTRLDGADWSGWSSASSVTLGPLSEGEHTFRVRGRDVAGNIGSATSHTWSVDVTPPALTLTVPANGAEYLFGSEILAEWSASDGGPGTTLSTTATSASGEAVDTTTAGSHLFFVEATDSAGNVARIEVTYHAVYLVTGAGCSDSGAYEDADE
ncbi:HYR domain-containing protein, partial [Candidatus Bipolaricaulota bacterium]|nr:HYR domain-containing protein [Candidatus Bipolaricaulota bacterium]